MARHPTAHGDSADIPWAGRELGPTGFETDDGRPDPHVRALLADPDVRESVLMSAIGGARFLVAIVATAAEVIEGDGGLHADSRVDTALVTLTSADGERALPIFSGTDSLAAWDPRARPVPVSAARIAEAAESEQCSVLVVDIAGPVTRTLRHSMLRALAERREWLPAHEDPYVGDAVGAAVEAEADLAAYELADGGEGELQVRLTARPGLSRAEVTAVLTRVGERLATDEDFRSRIDGLAFHLR